METVYHNSAPMAYSHSLRIECMAPSKVSPRRISTHKLPISRGHPRALGGAPVLSIFSASAVCLTQSASSRSSGREGSDPTHRWSTRRSAGPQVRRLAGSQVHRWAPLAEPNAAGEPLCGAARRESHWSAGRSQRWGLRGGILRENSGFLAESIDGKNERLDLAPPRPSGTALFSRSGSHRPTPSGSGRAPPLRRF
jgi:hypothetical protein